MGRGPSRGSTPNAWRKGEAPRVWNGWTPALRPNTEPISDGTLNSALARLGYKGIATAHGFRTLFSTCANEAGWNSDDIEKQLAHGERDEVRGAYNRAQWLGERAKLMQWWSDRLEALRKRN